jgi:hypothetical protein
MDLCCTYLLHLHSMCGPVLCCDVADIDSLPASALQTAFGNITATPSGLAGRKLLAGQRHHYHSADLAAGSDGAKPKCPFARLRELGLVQGLF